MTKKRRIGEPSPFLRLPEHAGYRQSRIHYHLTEMPIVGWSVLMALETETIVNFGMNQ